jgi:hypothetical protein
MSHQNARCASAAETLVVATGKSLPAVGDLSGKDLVVVQGTASGVLTWALTTQPPMSIVGQSTGTITANGVLAVSVHVTGGDVYIRNLTITGGSPGLLADGGGVVRLDHVSVINNPGTGIAIDGSAFDIRDATVTGNGSGSAGGTGIVLKNLSTAPTGPKSITLSTVSNNQTGVGCSTTSDAPATTSGVLVSGNPFADIIAACNFTSCGAASTTCGAQP